MRSNIWWNLSGMVREWMSFECTGSGHAQNLFRIRFSISSGPVSSACPSLRSTTEIPRYCVIESSHCSSAFFACSGFFFLNQHVRSPDVSVNNTYINICNAASCTSCIFAARTFDFAVKFQFVFRYDTFVFRRYVLGLLLVGL